MLTNRSPEEEKEVLDSRLTAPPFWVERLSWYVFCTDTREDCSSSKTAPPSAAVGGRERQEEEEADESWGWDGMGSERQQA